MDHSIPQVQLDAYNHISSTFVASPQVITDFTGRTLQVLSHRTTFSHQGQEAFIVDVHELRVPN